MFHLARFSLLAILLLAALSSAQQLPWDRLENSYFIFNSLPVNVSEASENGWSAQTGCNPKLGIAYNLQGGPTGTNPITLFFTKAGQIAGVGVTITDEPEAPVAGFWPRQSDGRYRLTVSFRSASTAIMCNGRTGPAIGDALIVAQDTASSMAIPLTESAASSLGWTNGSCLPKMGRHWAWDVTGQMSWNASTLMPVMPMYTNNYAVTFLVNTPNTEWYEPVGYFEGPFINALMCLNFCDSNCGFSGTHIWSTMHFFLTDPNTNNCSSRC